MLKDEEKVSHILKRKRKVEKYNTVSKVFVVEIEDDLPLVSFVDLKPKYQKYYNEFLKGGLKMKKREFETDKEEGYVVNKKFKYGSIVQEYDMVDDGRSDHQLRGMALFYSTFALRPDLFVGNPWDDNTDLHLRILLSVIKAENLVNDDLVLYRNVGNTHPGIINRPEYITNKVKEMEHIYIGSLLAMEKSFLSGTGVVGVYNAFRKFAQSKITVSVDIEEFSTAYLRMHVLLGVPQIDLPKVNVQSLMDFIRLPTRTKSGYSHSSNLVVQTIEKIVDGVVVRDVVVGSSNSNAQRCDSQFKAIEDIILKHRNYVAGDSSSDNYGVPVHVVAQKVEPREPHMWEMDRFKTRNFSMSPEPKMSEDYVLCKQFHWYICRRGGIAIGFKWRDNGASHMARKFEALVPGKWFYIVFDFTGLDYTLKEAVIALLAHECSYYFNPNHDDYKFYCWLAAMSATYTATKHVAWFGKVFKKTSSEYYSAKHICRLTRGCLCSGEYQTSSIDSRYVAITIMCFDEWITKKLIEGKKYKYTYNGVDYKVNFGDYSIHNWLAQFDPKYADILLERDFIPREIYGDDGELAYFAEFEDLLCYKVKGKDLPMLLMHYIETKFHMIPKISEVNVYSPKNCDSPFLTIVENDVMIRPGVKFLQRRFVLMDIDGKAVVAPWRETAAYYTKATTRAENLDKPEIYLAILRGLLLDTMGTNTVAYNYLSELEQEVMIRHPSSDRKLNAVLRSTDAGFGRDDWMSRIKRFGFDDPTILGVHMSQKQIRKLFVTADIDSGYPAFCLASTYRPKIY